MKAKVKHLFEVVAGFVLAMLGFNGCEEIINGVDEYGMPHASFKVIGTVKAADTNEPIDGIKVKFRQKMDEEFTNEIEFQSKNGGKVEETFYEWPFFESIEFTFEDVDGEENGGSFLPDTLRTKDLKIEFVEDKESNWHNGDYTISFDAKLNKEIPPEK